MKDIVVPLEPAAGAIDHDYALLGAYLLRVSCTTDAVEIWNSGQWLRFGLTGADVRERNETVFLTAPALHSLVKLA